MFKLLIQVMLTLSLCGLAFAQPESVKKAHAATHSIEMATIVENAGCSATAVAPDHSFRVTHALLTATHCELGTDDLLIDGDDAKITGRIRDGMDHTILLVDKEFVDYAEFSDRALDQGDTVYIFGNPGPLHDIMRFGTFSGIKQSLMSPPELLFDLNDFHGDSGAAIFDAVSGKVAGVVTGTVVLGQEPPDVMKMTFGLPLNFTKEQLKQIK